MAKERGIAPGTVVYHIAEAEKKPGVVTQVRLVEVDWGPETGTTVHAEEVLTQTFVPDYGSKS